jgi:hypothetical protein
MAMYDLALILYYTVVRRGVQQKNTAQQQQVDSHRRGTNHPLRGLTDVLERPGPPHTSFVFPSRHCTPSIIGNAKRASCKKGEDTGHIHISPIARHQTPLIKQSCNVEGEKEKGIFNGYKNGKTNQGPMIERADPAGLACSAFVYSPRSTTSI